MKGGLFLIIILAFLDSIWSKVILSRGLNDSMKRRDLQLNNHPNASASILPKTKQLLASEG